MKYIHTVLCTALLLLGLSQVSLAQGEAASVQATASEAGPTDNGDESTAKKATASTTAAANTTAQSECLLCRWIEPTAMSFSLRYRKMTDSTDTPTFDQAQQRSIIDFRLKFDAKARYTLNAHVSSGYYFNWAYADTGWGNTVNDVIHKTASGLAPFVAKDIIPGAVQSAVQSVIRAQYPNATPAQIAQLTPVLTQQLTPIVTKQVLAQVTQTLQNVNTRSKGWNLYFRQLYFAAQPVDGVEVQYGSLPINKGVNTEATSYDDDGYVTGGRVSVKRPDKLWFDEMSVTYAYLGDIFEVNFFRRTERVRQSNYHQFLVRKKLFGGRAEFSTDYTFQDGTDTMREAVKLNVKESKVLDAVRLEAYQRTSDRVFQGKLFKAANGFALTGEKTVAKRLTLGVTYADIDRQYTALAPDLDLYGFAINGDQTGLGRRVVVKAGYKLTNDLGVSMLYGRAFGTDKEEMGYIWNKTPFNVALTYDFMKLLKKTGLF